MAETDDERLMRVVREAAGDVLVALKALAEGYALTPRDPATWTHDDYAAIAALAKKLASAADVVAGAVERTT